MMSTVARRVGQVLLLPFFAVGLLIGLIVLALVLCWRTGVVGYHVTRDLLTRGA